MTDALMLVNALEKEETRIAVVAGTRLEDFHIERASRETLVGNIYKGRVENVHPSLQAAFVNIGLSRNAFLHVSEVSRPGEVRPPRRRGGPPRPKRLIQSLLSVGEEILVQVIRDEFGEKGPSVSMEVSLPGRFLVLTPLQPVTGISKKITDSAQRSNLRGILRDLMQEAGKMGLIVRTASADTQPQDLRADYDYLVGLWRAVEARAAGSAAPALVFEETDLVLRTVRDFFTKDISSIVVDDRAVWQQLRDFFTSVMPRYADRVQFYEGATPVFHKYEVEKQIEQLNQKSVDLPSGGSIVIEPTEAMTAIDVNSGRLVREANPEDLAFRTNCEAAREIMRQLRLRDVGGIVVVDFIDMKQERHKREVERELREEARRDRSQMVILPMSAFCLVQIARQKIRPSVQAVSHEPCPACGGTGFVKNLESVGLEIVRALKNSLDRSDVSVVEARVSPDVAGFLRAHMADLDQVQQRYGKKIHIQVVRDLPSNRVEFACYNGSGERIMDFVR